MVNVKVSTLDNGVRVISQHMPGTHSTALGIWMASGGFQGSRRQAGHAHLLEHLLFRGTRDQDAASLARSFEAMGGQVNAHTGRELTALHGLVPAVHMEALLTLFCDMLLQPRFDDADVDVERAIVLQELALIAATPLETIEDHAFLRAWPDHPLGWPVTGDPESLRSVDASGLRGYLDTILRAGNLCVVAAGAVDHDRLHAACVPLAGVAAGAVPQHTPPRYVACHEYLNLQTDQAHLLWLLPMPPAATQSYPHLVMATHMLGGGIASHLFRELRERRGLVYSLNTRLEMFSSAGLCLIQMSCDPGKARECVAITEETIQGFLDTGPADGELGRTREHLHARLLIEADDPESSMERLALESIYLERPVPLEERLHQIATVSGPELTGALRPPWERRGLLLLDPAR